MEDSLIDRYLLAVCRNKNLERFALKALLKTSELLGTALGLRLAQLRDSEEPLQQAFAQCEANALHARTWLEVAEILGSRWDKIPERKRPHYTPRQRFRILHLMHFFAWSSKEAASVFRIAPQTLHRWERIGPAPDGTEAIGSRVQPEPPVRRFADVVRHIVQDMAGMGFGGSRRIAQTLTRAGWKLSRRTVQRVLREPRPPIPESAPLKVESTNERDADTKPLIANQPHHVWMLDITDIPALFRITSFKLAVVLDVFSRMPLAFRVFRKEPSTEQMLQLFQDALRHATPRYAVTDRGTQFTAKAFTDKLSELGIQQRFGAIGTHGSIAIIERLWKTLKALLLLKPLRPLAHTELEQRIRIGLHYYAHHRPHQGLGGTTPAELFFEQAPQHTNAVPPPRAKRGQGPRGSPFEIDFLDHEQLFPVLVDKAA